MWQMYSQCQFMVNVVHKFLHQKEASLLTVISDLHSASVDLSRCTLIPWPSLTGERSRGLINDLHCLARKGLWKELEFLWQKKAEWDKNSWIRFWIWLAKDILWLLWIRISSESNSMLVYISSAKRASQGNLFPAWFTSPQQARTGPVKFIVFIFSSQTIKQ